MTALPIRGGGRVTTPRPRPAAPLPRDETEALRRAIDDALDAAHRAERQLRRSMAADGVAATGLVLGVSRATASRIRAGHWPVVTALTRLQDTLRAG